MRPLPAFLKVFRLGLLEWRILFEDSVNIRNERLIFLRSWEMNLGEAVTNLPRTASRFMGFVTASGQVHFPMNAEKKTHSLIELLLWRGMHNIICTVPKRTTSIMQSL